MGAAISGEPKIEAPKQLLVEGRTPKLFFEAWLRHLQIKGDIDVQDFRAVNELGPYLRVFSSRREFKEKVTALAIIRDAEQGPAKNAFDSVGSALQAAGISPPSAMAQYSTATPKVGVFILPDGQNGGMLEDLCWSVLRARPADPRLECVDRYVACLRQSNSAIQNESKGKMWAYLAGLGEFDPQVGRAAQKNVFDWNAAIFSPLRLFLTSL